MERNLWIGLIFCFLSSINLGAQEENQRKWELRGYVSDMITFDWTRDTLQLDNLIHNRLNFKWFPADFINIKIDLRTRLFLGHSISSLPSFGQIIDSQNDYFNLSLQFPEKKEWLLHTMVDRAYIEWYKNDWEIRLGRQRINWGVNLVWNPNDLFNAYSFYDFDYVERPGSDALLVKKYIGATSSLEFAMNTAANFDDIIMAAKYSWNKRSYDFQVIGAKAKTDMVVGLAWQGNIKGAGFKGELSFFYPYLNNIDSNNALLMAVISGDYAFKSSLYLHTGLLFNSNGSDAIDTHGFVFTGLSTLSARTLSPFKWSVFFQSTYQLHPLLTGGSAIIYFPGKRNALFINPNLSYSLKENLDLSLIFQLYYDDINGNYKAFAQSAFFRAKLSF